MHANIAFDSLIFVENFRLACVFLGDKKFKKVNFISLTVHFKNKFLYEKLIILNSSVISQSVGRKINKLALVLDMYKVSQF